MLTKDQIVVLDENVEIYLKHYLYRLERGMNGVRASIYPGSRSAGPIPSAQSFSVQFSIEYLEKLEDIRNQMRIPLGSPWIARLKAYLARFKGIFEGVLTKQFGSKINFNWKEPESWIAAKEAEASTAKKVLKRTKKISKTPTDPIHTFKFAGNNSVWYNKARYPLSALQYEGLKTSIEIWNQNGNKKVKVHNSEVFGMDKDQTIGRIFKNHDFLTKLGIWKPFKNAKGFFIFNP